MSHALSSLFLNADKVIVPYETIAGGKQVSTLIVVSGSIHDVFSLVEGENDLGPVMLNRREIAPDKIASWLEEHASTCETIVPKCVRVMECSFWYEGSIETVIDAIDFAGDEGQRLWMSRSGAAYPYSLVLMDTAK